MTEGLELPNQEKIRTLGEKDMYKYLVHHQTSGDERKKKLKMSISGELENSSKPNYITIFTNPSARAG